MSQFFPTRQNKHLIETDFNTTTIDKLLLNSNELSIVLFYDNTNLSHELLEIINDISKKIMNVNIYSCNVIEQENIHLKIKTIINNEKNIITHDVPFIIVYNNCIPIKLYTGIYNKIDLILFISNLSS